MRNRAHYVDDGSPAAISLGETLRKMRDAKLPTVPADAPWTMSLDFGRYKGRPIRQVPTHYLMWLRENLLIPYPEQRAAFAAAMLELRNREASGRKDPERDFFPCAFCLERFDNPDARGAHEETCDADGEHHK